MSTTRGWGRGTVYFLGDSCRDGPVADLTSREIQRCDDIG